MTLKASADFESDKKSYHFDVVADDGTTQVSKNVHVDVTSDPLQMMGTIPHKSL